jgi:hypothetical protein
VQDAAPQSEAHQRAPTSGSVPAVTPTSSAAVPVAEPRTAGGRKLWKIKACFRGFLKSRSWSSEASRF